MRPIRRVELTANFRRTLDGVDAFLREAGATEAFASLLYATDERTVYLMAIRHHRQLSFDFSGLWNDV